MSKEAFTSKHPLGSESSIGDVRWVMGLTNWSHDKVARLCRLKRIKGAFQAQPGTRGSMWLFRKNRTLGWLKSLEVE
jgi:hypothetical protein